MSINRVSSNQSLERAWPILVGLEEDPLPATRLKRKIEQTYMLSIEPGTFYATLANLERRSWIERAHTSPLAYVYSLTADGRAALQQHGALASTHHERIQTRTSNVTLRGGIMKLATWVVKLYPKAWRERYEEEMLALLTEHPITFLTIFDLLFGVLDARLDPHYRTERHLFELKSPNVAMMAFFAVVTVFLFLVQGSIFGIMAGATILFGRSQSFVVFVVGALPTDIFNGVLCFIAILVAFASIRRIVAARRIGMTLLAVACFVIPIVLVLLPIMSAVSEYILFGNGIFAFVIGGKDPFGVWMGLESLMGILLLTILKIKQAITTQNKRMFFLVILIDALLVLRTIGFLFLIPTLARMPVLWKPLSVLTLLATGLLPFSTIGVLLLALAGRAFGEWTRRSVLAIVGPVTLTMIMYLLFFLVGSWPVWMQRGILDTGMSGGVVPWFLGEFPIGVVGAGMLLCILLAFVVCRSLLLALPRKLATKDAVQELPAMEMRQ